MSIALKDERKDVVQTLLEGGANPNTKITGSYEKALPALLWSLNKGVESIEER